MGFLGGTGAVDFDTGGRWIVSRVGNALDGFFRKPYLLWFIAEDPVRNGALPANIADIARVIIRAAALGGVETLQEQLDHALRLVSWSWIARDSNVQIGLVDVLGGTALGWADYGGQAEIAECLRTRGAK